MLACSTRAATLLIILAVSKRVLSFWCGTLLNDLTHGGVHLAATLILDITGASTLRAAFAHTSAGVDVCVAPQNAACSDSDWCGHGMIVEFVLVLHLAMV